MNYISEHASLIHVRNNIKTQIGLIYSCLTYYSSKNRRYLAFTKTRGQCQGGGRKPWQQKGTGRARAGSTRSPLFRGGGIIFGPTVKTVSVKKNRKLLTLAYLLAFKLKLDSLFIMRAGDFCCLKGISAKDFANSRDLAVETSNVFYVDNLKKMLSLTGLVTSKIRLLLF
jgi:50S ribosomal protein L4